MKYTKFNSFKQGPLMLKKDIANNKVVFANWKMSVGIQDVLNLCDGIADEIKKNPTIKNKLVIAPPSIYQLMTYELIPEIKRAGQDVSVVENKYGAFTGEISAYMLMQMAVQYCIVGHYERRKYFGETSQTVRAKAQNCLNSGLVPIICFGEEEIGQDPLQAMLEIDSHFSQESSIIYAYEPYWAIGSENFKFDVVRPNLEKLINYLKHSNNKSLIYGGSVNSQNIVQLNTIENLDGLLVGSASLKINELLKILENV